MNRITYIQQGRAAYAQGRVIIMPPDRHRSWQRAAFRYGYMKARDEWRAAHPKANEWDNQRKRSAAWCRSMVTP